MAVDELKKGITMMIMMLTIMFVVAQLCGTTQSLDISTKKYCDDCRMMCRNECSIFNCILGCMQRNCNCCVTNSPACV